MNVLIFALTAFFIGGVLGLRFKVLVLVAPLVIGFFAIVGIGLAFGGSAGFILFVVFVGMTALELGYVAGAVIGCFAVKPRVQKDSPEIIAASPRLYRRSQS